MGSKRPGASLLLALGLALQGCADGTPPDEGLAIGLLLSYSGHLAASSISSERALLMAIEAANAGGGVGGRPVRVLARDTGSSPQLVGSVADELLGAGVAMIIGPDNTDLTAQVRTVLLDRTVILPSLNTTSDVQWKPTSWFVMGPSTSRLACELMEQLKVDGRSRPMLIANQDGQNNALSWEIGLTLGVPREVLPKEAKLTKETLAHVTSTAWDSYILAASPASASALVYALAAVDKLEPERWYLSPTLHTPAFLESIPKGTFTNAQGVTSGSALGSADFRVQFSAQWQDVPLDDAYAFYDAGALAVLAMQRALAMEGAIPEGTGLQRHIVALTRPGGTPILWNQLARGLELLGLGEEIEYIALSGAIEFDEAGQPKRASTRWWRINDKGFYDIPSRSACERGATPAPGPSPAQ